MGIICGTVQNSQTVVLIIQSFLSDIRAEMMPDVLPDRSEVSKFDHSKLKHVNVTEKVILPSKEGRPRSGFFYLSFMC